MALPFLEFTIVLTLGNKSSLTVQTFNISKATSSVTTATVTTSRWVESPVSFTVTPTGFRGLGQRREDVTIRCPALAELCSIRARWLTLFVLVITIVVTFGNQRRWSVVSQFPLSVLLTLRSC